MRQVQWHRRGLALLLWVVGIVSNLAGAEGASLSISPMLVEMQATPGRTTQANIVVENDAVAGEARIKARVMPVIATREGAYTLVEGAANLPYSAASWVSVSPNEFTLSPGQAAALTIEAKTPRLERPGGRYAAIALDLQPDMKTDATASASISVVYRLVCLVEITVGNPVSKKAHIDNLEIIPATSLNLFGATFHEKALAIRASLVNDGVIHVNGKGKLIVRDNNGRKLGEIPLGQGRGTVWPGSTLDFISIFPAGLPSGTYSVQAMLEYGGLRPAIAKATFQVKDDGTSLGNSGGAVAQVDVQPENISVELPEGAIRGEVVTVTNFSDKPVHVTTHVSPLAFNKHGELDTDVLEESLEGNRWVQIDPSEFSLRPGERRRIRVTVMNDRSVPGASYANINFIASVEPDKMEQGAASRLSADLSTTVFMIPRDGVEKNLAITSVITLLPTASNPFGVAFSVINTGNVHVKGEALLALARKETPTLAGGGTYIGNAIYKEIWNGVVPSETLAQILPGELRELETYVPIALDPGDYRYTLTINYGGRTPVVTQGEFAIPSTSQYVKE